MRAQRRSIQTFNDFVVATGGRPLLRVPNQQLMSGRFDVSVPIADNVASAVDLTLQNAWDRQVQNLYGSGSARIEGVFRLAGFRLYVADATFRSEATALKLLLDDGGYLHLVRNANTRDIPIRGHIYEPYSQFEFHEATNTAVERVLFRGPMRQLDRPLNIDLRSDTMQFIAPAINWAGNTTVQTYLQLFGHLAPRDFYGALASDADACAVNEVMEDNSAAPATFAQLTVQGFGGSLLAGPQQWGGGSIG